MKYLVDSGEFELEAGKRFRANSGLLSIGENGEGNPLYVAEGYDRPLMENLTAEECKEIADYMIGLWSRWAEGG